MAHLYATDDVVSDYIRKRERFYSKEGWNQILDALSKSCTLYVGNLSFYTMEPQVYALFSQVAPVRRVIMGLNKQENTPCGFCFVEYYAAEAASTARKAINETRLDSRFIRVDMDPGFEEGRQYGRGRAGGQVREDYRDDFDDQRGGWGENAKRQRGRGGVVHRGSYRGRGRGGYRGRGRGDNRNHNQRRRYSRSPDRGKQARRDRKADVSDDEK